MATASSGTVAKPSEPLAMTLRYTPFGARSEIELKASVVRSVIATKTRSGKAPTDADIYKFMMLCQARELDPFVGDAYLIGFDSKDGPAFNLITSLQALLKRAEVNPAYRGIEQGVIIQHKDGALEERHGDLVLDGEKLVGAWAKVHRADRIVPDYDRIKLETYRKPFGVWSSDPAGMLVKCAQASVLRQAFPTQLGGLYISQEQALMAGDTVAAKPNAVKRITLESLKAKDVKPADEPAAIEATPTVDPGEVVTKEQAAKLGDMAMASMLSGEELGGIFGRYGVDSFDEIPASEYQAVYDELLEGLPQ